MGEALPSRVEQVVDLIRRPGIDRDAAIALVEQYASVVAGEAAIKATQESYANCISTLDQALSMPLATRTTAEGGV